MNGPFLPSVVAIALLVGWCRALGAALCRCALAARPGAGGAVLEIALGVVVLHVLYLGSAWAGLRLTRGVLVAVLLGVLGLAFAAARLRRGRDRPRPQRYVGSSLHWGDWLALLFVLAFAAVVVAGRGAHSDFVYHWGLKGVRDAQVAGIDWSLRARPENGYLHPDYPNLFPVLIAVSSRLAGGFCEVAQQLWSVLGLLGLWGAARSETGRWLSRRWSAPATVAIVGSAAAFSIGYAQGGSADPLFALPVFALAALSIAPAPLGERALATAVMAALAAALKMEGLPLAAFALLLFAAREGARSARPLRARAAGAALVVLPTLLVVLPWWWGVARHHLLLDNLDALDVARLAPTFSASWRVLTLPEWHRLPFLLALLPLFAACRRTRALGVLLVLQLGFYFWPYLGSNTEPEFHVLSSLPRLLLHLVPPAVFALAVLCAPGERSALTPRSAAAP